MEARVTEPLGCPTSLLYKRKLKLTVAYPTGFLLWGCKSCKKKKKKTFSQVVCLDRYHEVGTHLMYPFWPCGIKYLYADGSPPPTQDINKVHHEREHCGPTPKWAEDSWCGLCTVLGRKSWEKCIKQHLNTLAKHFTKRLGVTKEGIYHLPASVSISGEWNSSTSFKGGSTY